MYCIIYSTFYTNIAQAQLEAAQAALDAADEEYTTVEVPGAFEIPAAIAVLNEQYDYTGYIALGCVIRGETSHYDYVCGESARGINQLAIDHKLAIGYGIITAEDKAQAEARQTIVGTRAAEAALRIAELKERN